jgi:hypothetical protein
MMPHSTDERTTRLIPHGTLGGYTGRHHCRCTACCDANTAYARRRRDQLHKGIWRGRVDNQQARDHIAALRRTGMSIDTIETLSGVPKSVLTHTTTHARYILKRNADAILTITPTHEGVPPTHRVPATGTRRRVQALCRIGWPLSAIGGHLGVSKEATNALLNRPKVTAAKATAVAKVYDRLSMTPGPSVRARRAAEASGWAPPLAWDDDTIDYPTAKPDLGRHEQGVVDIGDVEHLVGYGYTWATLVDHLGIQADSIRTYLRRAGRLDLAAHLDRNAVPA